MHDVLHHRLECDMATNVKKEEAANAPKARAAALQTELNRLENIKVCPDVLQPLVSGRAAELFCERLMFASSSPPPGGLSGTGLLQRHSSCTLQALEYLRSTQLAKATVEAESAAKVHLLLLYHLARGPANLLQFTWMSPLTHSSSLKGSQHACSTECLTFTVLNRWRQARALPGRAQADAELYTQEQQVRAAATYLP